MNGVPRTELNKYDPRRDIPVKKNTAKSTMGRQAIHQRASLGGYVAPGELQGHGDVLSRAALPNQ